MRAGGARWTNSFCNSLNSIGRDGHFRLNPNRTEQRCRQHAQRSSGRCEKSRLASQRWTNYQCIRRLTGSICLRRKASCGKQWQRCTRGLFPLRRSEIFPRSVIEFECEESNASYPSYEAVYFERRPTHFVGGIKIKYARMFTSKGAKPTARKRYARCNCLCLYAAMLSYVSRARSGESRFVK